MSWVQSQRPGVDGVNIITSDFVELTDFANIVIKLNNLLLSESERKSRWHMPHFWPELWWFGFMSFSLFG